MSGVCTKLCSMLIGENFGTIIQSVADVLLQKGPYSLQRLARDLKDVPLKSLQEALRIMTQHNIVTIDTCKTSYETSYQYTIHCDMAIELLRYPKYFAQAKKQTGTVSMEILEEVMRAGWIPISKLIYICGSRVKETNPDISEDSMMEQLTLFYNTINNLALRKYIVIVPQTFIPGEDSSESNSNGRDSFEVPTIDAYAICSKLFGKNELELHKLPDADIVWKINIKQFQAELRNIMVYEALERKHKSVFDTRILKIIIEMGYEKHPWERDGCPVSIAEIKDRVEQLEGGDLTSKFLDEQMEIIEEDPKRIVTRLSNTHGGHYSFNMKIAVEECFWSTIDKIITERHGFLASRIFRLVKDQGFVEQEVINETGMVPSKDAKHLTYKLVEDSFLRIKEIRRVYAASAPPSKVIALFFVDVDQVIRSFHESCCKAMLNLKIRSNHEKEKNNLLLNKEEKISRILTNMANKKCSEAQLNEVRELLTPPERGLLMRYQFNTRKLLSGIMHVDETLFLIELFVHYNKRILKNKK